MEAVDLFTAIKDVGYPIVMTIYLLWYMRYLDDKHDNEVSKLRDIVEKNTQAILSLTESIRFLKEKDGSD